MNAIIAVFKRELKSYFISPIAYVFMILFTWATMYIFFFINQFFFVREVSMRGYFHLMPWYFFIFIPAISMRIWSEERKLKTMEILLTLPIKDWEAVIGKFLASYAFLIFTILLSFFLPVSLAYLGDPDGGAILANYIGAILMGGAYLAIGLFFSAITEEQINAFIVTVVTTFLLVLIGWQIDTIQQMITPILFVLALICALVFLFIGLFISGEKEDRLMAAIVGIFCVSLFGGFGIITIVKPGTMIYAVQAIQYISLSYHFQNIERGVVDLKDLVYYMVIMGSFLYLNIKALKISEI
ncbi:MAG: ABC transporter permease [bacterium]